MKDSRSCTQNLSRRTILKGMGMAPLLFRSAPFQGASLLFAQPSVNAAQAFPYADHRLTPHYPTQSPLSDVLRLITPGSDSYVTEKYASDIESILEKWSEGMKTSPLEISSILKYLAPSFVSSSLLPTKEIPRRTGYGINVIRREFTPALVNRREEFIKHLHAWVGEIQRIETAEFEIFTIDEIAADPLTVRLSIRYDLVNLRKTGEREELVGTWITEWFNDKAGWSARTWEASEETVSSLRGPGFIDVTQQALGNESSYKEQIMRGSDHWRTVLDAAIGTDVYCNNGVAVGDYDKDGFDDFYVCQPSGLPNRLYRNCGDGSFEDVTEKAGVGVLDNTACALFADFENKGVQDLLVVCGTGPMLFQNQGNGRFALKQDAFKFAKPPQGADYDRDGRLDIYLCTYMYYLGLDQYHYPIPYYDARNGPPNLLFHNEGHGDFVEVTEAAGLNIDNDRYSFSCAWGDANGDGLPDLFVVNDFGSSQLYRNNGNGTFTVASHQAHVEDVGAGMSCAWCDYDNDGHQDVYVPSMWEAAGQRVSGQKQFHEKAAPATRELYQRHARGNALYRNQGDGTFQNTGNHAGVEMGRWSWSSDFWDFDHDGFSDLYVANGYLSGSEKNDLASFFWRQVVAKSSEDATGALAYEQGWNAIQELVRSDSTWHGYARNVFFANNRDGSFTEASGPLKLDFIEDCRTFALADIDHDGRLEIILKNRNAPQLRILHNAMSEIGESVAFRLCGHPSNRDAIGTSITVEAGSLTQTKYLQAGSGFLAQHTKELFFGVGSAKGTVKATLRWPSGTVQIFEAIPTQHRIEIEEGSPGFTVLPYAETNKTYKKESNTSPIQPLPTRVETWLIDPIKAPSFSLSDLDDRKCTLESVLGKKVLLHFWESNTSICREQIIALHRSQSQFTAHQLEILAINVDGDRQKQEARIFAVQQGVSFPVLFASEEMAGIYNILYCHLFDRRRDLILPASFLLNKDGMIVKVYQGPLEINHLLLDVHRIPETQTEQMQKALPFAGTYYQGRFQRNDFTYGVVFFQHGYLKEAAESFQQVIEAKPDNPDAYYNLGTLELRGNNFVEARRLLERALQLRPNYPEAWNNLGMISAQQSKEDEAIRCFQQSLKLRPKYAMAFLNLGNVYRRRSDFVKAEEALQHAVELKPDDPEIQFSLGMLNAQQEQNQPASEYLHKAIELRPNYPEALNNLGVLLVRMRDYMQAEELFKRCIVLAPKFDQPYLNLSRLYALRHDKERASSVLQDLLQVDPKHSGALQYLRMLQ